MFIVKRRRTPRRVRAGAALLATLAPFTLAGLLLASQQDVLPVEDERIEVVFFEDAPAPAPGPKIAAPPGPKNEVPEVQPQTPPVETPPQTEPDPDAEPDADTSSDDVDGAVVADLTPTPGGGGGGGGGCEVEPCDPDGCVGPDCDGGGGTGPTAVHWSKVKVKRQVPPKMPAAARQLGPMEQKCTVRMTIDTRGRVTHVDPVDCPPLFHDSAVTAAGKWRFEPMKVEGRAVDATFLLTIRYQVE